MNLKIDNFRQNIAFAKQTILKFRSTFSEITGAYINYVDDAASLSDYYGSSLPLLQRTKQTVDPNQLFDFPLAISNRTSPCTLNATDMRNLALAFQLTQVQMDASMAAALFASNGITRIPFGTGASNVGRAAIQKSFANYYATLVDINETILSPLLVSGSVVAFSKSIDTLSKAGQHRSITVVNWFNMSCSSTSNLLQIAEFDAVFNV